MEVLAKVQEHVGKGVADLRRATEMSSVIAVRPDGATPGPNAVHGERAPAREALDSSDERTAGVSLDQEVQMVGLHREVEDPERCAARQRQRSDEAPERPG